MPGLRFANSANTEKHLLQRRPISRQLTTIVRCLVGYTVDEVERELILNSLDHYHGSRTYTANVLGISIRCLRNKISQYAAMGIAVPEPGQRQDRFVPETPLSFNGNIQGRCPDCGTPLRLSLIEPERPDHDKRTFECTECEHSETAVIKYN